MYLVLAAHAIIVTTSGSSLDVDYFFFLSLQPQALPTILLLYFMLLAMLLSAQIATSITAISPSSSSPRLPPLGLINQLTFSTLEHQVTDGALFFCVQSVLNYLLLQYEKGPRLERLLTMKTMEGWKNWIKLYGKH